MPKAFLASVMLLFVYAATMAQSPAPMLFGRLTVNRTHIAFYYAGYVWTVERAGGEARRLTSDTSSENHPVFSPDGTQIAFSRFIGGQFDVFVMPAAGGEARRLTFNPEDDLVMNWTPDGRNILFMSHRDEENVHRLYTMPVDGVNPTALPLPQAYAGSFSPDGRRIAYSPRRSLAEWRHYRGGMTAPVHVVNLANGALERLPHNNTNDESPMWIGERIYFVSDRAGAANLFVYHLSSRRTEQLTRFERHGIRFAGAGGDAIAFVRDGRIHLYDLTANRESQIDVRVNITNTPELNSRTVNASRFIESAMPSTSGDRVVFGARGETFIFDPSTGEARNLTRTSGAAERYAQMSPDNSRVAYFSDEGGEYALHVRAADGTGEVLRITIERQPSFYRSLTWSPDSRRIAFVGKNLTLFVADVQGGTARQIDSSTYSYQGSFLPVWSPDGRFLAYSKHLANRVRTIFIYDVERARTIQITDGRTHTESPVFDANGKYLYFVSSANAGTSEFGWGVLSGEFARPIVTRRVHAIVLQSDGQSPILPNGQPNPEARINENASPVRIDFENINRRVVDLPLAPRDYTRLMSGRAGVLNILVTEWPPAPAPSGNPPARSLYTYDLSRPPNFERFVERVEEIELTRDGSRVLFRRGRDWFLVPTNAVPQGEAGKLNLARMEMTVDPRAEWRQIYREAWRLMRDWFYDPAHHGQNLVELERDYARYLPSITRRSDLNNLMRQMLGHVSISHLGVGGGDSPPPPAGQSPNIGLLGADYEVVGNRYRFKRIYRSSLFNSLGGSVGAPLDRPGINVREGEYLLAVGDRQVDATRSVYSYFENTAGQATRITVGPNPDGTNARTLTVFPSNGENILRRANWAEANRRRVEEMSGGRLGYIYVGDYGEGIYNFIRGLTGYGDRQGIIIDQRFNGGGITPDYLIEWLRRRPLYYYRFRDGDDIPTPVNPGPATSVLLINEHNGSAAETFAFMFKLGRVGQIVGMRTYGAGIGPYVFTPPLIDGGRIQIPNRAAYNPDGTSWGIENIGVVPDIEVEITPQDFIAGRDPQLERAIQAAMQNLNRNTARPPRRPAFPMHPR
jgi:tricorn protease